MFVTMSEVRLRQPKFYLLRSIKWVGILEMRIRVNWFICRMVISATRVIEMVDSSYVQDPRTYMY